MTRIRTAGAIAAALLAAPLIAQSTPRPPLTFAAAQAAAKAKFERTDANHDGVVTRDEVAAAMAARTAEYKATQASRFDALDANHDGQLSRDEFAAGSPMAWHGRGMAMKAQGTMPGKGMERAALADRWFSLADTNKDGRVTLAEADALVASRFRKADANNDGTIAPAERRARHEQLHETSRTPG